MQLKPFYLAIIIISKLIISPIFGFLFNGLLMTMFPNIYYSNYPLFFYIFLLWITPTSIVLLTLFLILKMY